LQQPVYDASATVVVSPKGGTQDNFSNTISGLQALAIEMEATGLNRSMVEEIVNTVESSIVSAADINNNLTIAQLEDTRFLALTYSDTFKRRAQEIVNVTVKTFAQRRLMKQAGWQPMQILTRMLWLECQPHPRIPTRCATASGHFS